MESTLFATGCLALLLWGWLYLRGRFWQSDPDFDPARDEPRSWPAVAALVAGGNDPEAIEDTLPALLTQAYPGALHVVLVVPAGRDDIAEAARRAAHAAGAVQRLSLLHAEAPPAGWRDRAWLLAQAQAHAAAQVPGLGYLWLTEPWVEHGRYALRDMVTQAQGARCDLVSLLPIATSEALWERLPAAAFAFFFQAFHPFTRVNDPQNAAAAAAPGCALVSAEALQAAGGFAAIKDAPALESALAARIKPAARQRSRRIWLGLGTDSTAVRAGDDWRLLPGLALASVAAAGRPTARRLALDLAGLALAGVAPAAVFLWALVAGFFLDIDQFLITFLALVVACGAWAAMAFAAWPTFERHELEEWHTLLLPLAAVSQILLTLTLLPRRFGTAHRQGKTETSKSASKGAAPTRDAAVRVEPRLDPPARRETTPSPPEPAAAPRPAARHGLRRRIARS